MKRGLSVRLNKKYNVIAGNFFSKCFPKSFPMGTVKFIFKHEFFQRISEKKQQRRDLHLRKQYANEPISKPIRDRKSVV